jgi:hypothetical protein
VQSGDEIVVFGQDALQEDDPVNVNWHQWTRRTDLLDEEPEL